MSTKLLKPEVFTVSRILVQRCLEVFHINIDADMISLSYHSESIIDGKEVVKIFVEISTVSLTKEQINELADNQFIVYYYPVENKVSLSLFKRTAIEHSYSGIFHTTYDFTSSVF